MKSDIAGRGDIEVMVRTFYDKVKIDPVIGPIFNDVAKVDWPHHIALICAFWNSVMLKTNEYHGNAYNKHVMLGKKTQLTEAHFAHWLKLFREEAFKCLSRQDAEAIMHKANVIAHSLKLGSIPPSKTYKEN